MDEVFEDPAGEVQVVDDRWFTITVDATTLALLGTSPEELMMGSDTIPEDRGFNEEAWEAQLQEDIAEHMSEPAGDEDDDVPPDSGATDRV